MKFFNYILTIVVLLSWAEGYPLEEHYGYIDVKEGSHMFYVLYETDSTECGIWTDCPLIMWLQGGPGSSGVGYGNFFELGPYDMTYNLRPGRWTKKANLLFVDQPVGTGYSYVDERSLYNTNNQQIADDLVEFTKQLFTQMPDLQYMPFFVYAESYGGKMTVDYALTLTQAIRDGDIICNFQGIALGDSWISPIDSVNTWGPFLYGMGYVNELELEAIKAQANVTQTAVDDGNWGDATNEWSKTELVVLAETGGVDFYNIFNSEENAYSPTTAASLSEDDLSAVLPESLRHLYRNHVQRFQGSSKTMSLFQFMNGVQKDRWNIPTSVTWSGIQSEWVFAELNNDFMKPAVDSVAMLLNTTNVFTAVYTGDFDLICDTPGTYKWIDEMEWDGKEAFEATSRKRIFISSQSAHAGYVQQTDKFALFTLLRCGHMSPIDQPELCLQMIDMISDYAAELNPPEQNKEPQVPSEEELVKEKEELLSLKEQFAHEKNQKDQQ